MKAGAPQRCERDGQMPWLAHESSLSTVAWKAGWPCVWFESGNRSHFAVAIKICKRCPALDTRFFNRSEFHPVLLQYLRVSCSTVPWQAHKTNSDKFLTKVQKKLTSAVLHTADISPNLGNVLHIQGATTWTGVPQLAEELHNIKGGALNPGSKLQGASNICFTSLYARGTPKSVQY